MTVQICSADRVPATSGIRVRLEPVDLTWLGRAWRALELRSEPPFFRSWGWIGCWLQHLPPDRQPFAAVATDGDEVVGLAVFLARRKRRYGVIPVDSLALHQSGDAALDALHIEHNGLLAAPRDAPAAWQAILDLLTRGSSWREVLLGGLEQTTAALCTQAARTQGCEVVIHRRTRSAHLDLARLRRSGRGLAPTLSRNSRHQLARARRLYEATGPLSLRAAQSADEALAMFEQLKTLHQKSWQARGQPGCFARPFFETFHRDLISRRFRHGEIQLLRAAAGSRPIGYLYNFAHRDRVYAYQSGFDYAADGRLKPGLVTHALAIEQAMRDGFATYDFLAGENRLKASFASHWGEMVWLSVQQPAAAAWLRSQRSRFMLNARSFAFGPWARTRRSAASVAGSAASNALGKDATIASCAAVPVPRHDEEDRAATSRE